MERMQYLKENKKLFFIVLLLPLFFIYFDKVVISLMRNLDKANHEIYSFLESLDPFINFISHGATLIIIAFLLYVMGRYFHQRAYEVGRSMIIGFISSGIVAQIMKHLIGRARPRLTDNLVFIGPSLKSGYDSFPSGHTTVVFCLAYILSHHFPRYRVFFYICAVIVGFERVEDVSHFPSDVITGAIVGILVAKLLSVRMFPSGMPSTSK